MSSKSNSAEPALELYRIKKTSKVGKVFCYIGLIFWTFINLFPIYWMFVFSLKDNKEIFGENVIGLPRDWLWSNYFDALTSGFKFEKLSGFSQTLLNWAGYDAALPKAEQAGAAKVVMSLTSDMGGYFLNSIIVAVLTILITLLAALMATYAITRIVWRGRQAMNKFFMLGLTIPIHASIFPIFLVLSRTGLTDSYIALIAPYSAFALSMAILICTGFMDGIPKDLDEAAYIDGCGTWRSFFSIIVPLMKPAVATVGIYTFLQCWNELMFASIFNSKADYKTLPMGIQELSGRYTVKWGPIGAALVVATFPTLIVYVFLSRRIQESFIAGAIKG